MEGIWTRNSNDVLQRLTLWFNMLISLVPVTLLFLTILLNPEILAQQSILQHLLIHRAHRKHLTTLVLRPSTMQWLPFKIYRWKMQTPVLIRNEDLGSACNHWLHTLLGPEFSSDVMGDGARSAAAVSRRAASRRSKFIAKVQAKRASQVISRMDPAASINPVLACETAPLHGTKSRPRRPSSVTPVTPSAKAFYEAHKGDNKWIRLEEGGTIAGTETDKGVFAKTNIPPNTRITPYLGRIRPPNTKGPYCLLVKDSEDNDICLDSAHELYDVGYTVGLSDHQKSRTPTRPNYGRYVNSLRPDQLAEGKVFNAEFVPDPVEGFSWIQSGPLQILAGTEILVDYGAQYWIRAHHTRPTRPGHQSKLAPQVLTKIVEPAAPRDEIETHRFATCCKLPEQLQDARRHPSGTSHGKKCSSNTLGDGARNPSQARTRQDVDDQTTNDMEDTLRPHTPPLMNAVGHQTHPSSTRFGKSFRFDVTGDGAWRQANSTWLQMFDFDREEYTLGRDSVTLYEGRTGIRILLSDIDRYRRGDIPLNGIPIQHLEQHSYMHQGHWHAVLQAL